MVKGSKRLMLMILIVIFMLLFASNIVNATRKQDFFAQWNAPSTTNNGTGINGIANLSTPANSIVKYGFHPKLGDVWDVTTFGTDQKGFRNVTFNQTLNAEFSVDFWVMRNGSITNRYALEPRQAGVGQWTFIGMGSDNQISATGGATENISFNLIDLQFHHYNVCIYTNGTRMNATVDGIRVNNVTVVSNNGQVNRITLGRTDRTTAESENWHGMVDQVTLYEGCLNQSDILDLNNTNFSLSSTSSDTTAPTYAGNLTNFSSLNNSFPAGMNVTWTDDTALAYCIPSIDDGVGSFTNLSVVPLTGTTGTCNATRTVLGFPHTLFRWRFYANDSSSNINVTTIMQMNISDIQAPTYSNNFTNDTSLFAGDTVIFNVTFSDNTSLQSCIPSLDNGSGSFINQTPTIISGTTGVCNLTHTLTAQASQIIRWRFYGNDTTKNMNETSISQINVSNTAPIIQTLTPSDGYNDRTNLSILVNVTDLDTLQTLTIYLHVNGTMNISSTVTNGALTNITVTQMGLEGNYTWGINASDGITNISSVLRSYIMDVSSPILTRSFTNITLSPKLTNLTLNDSCRDDNLFTYRINITNSTNNYIYNISEIINTTLTNFNFTNIINISKMDDGDVNAFSECSDDHTKRIPDDYNKSIDKDLGEIKFTTSENGDKISIKLKSVDPNITLYNMTIKYLDSKYGFSFNFSNGTNEDGRIYTYVFKLKNSYKLTHRPLSPFPAHFVTSNNFIDFRLKDGVANYSVKQTVDNKFEITIDTNKTDLVFDSVGGLNIVSATSTILIDSISPSINYSNGIEGNNSYVNRAWVFVNVTITELHLKNMTFWLYYASNKTLHNQTSFLTATNSLNFSNIPEASYIYNVSIYDNASNYNSTSSINITTDTILPTTYQISPVNNFVSSGAKVDLSYNISDTNFNNCTTYWNSLAIFNTTFNNSPYLANITYESQQSSGSSTWFIDCYDRANNRNYTSNRTISFSLTSSGGGGGGSSGIGFSPVIVVPSLSIAPPDEPKEAFFGTCNTKVKPTKIRLNENVMSGTLQLFNYEQRNISFNLSVITTSGNSAEDFISLNVTSLVMPYNSNTEIGVTLLTTNFVPDDMLIEINSNCGTRVIPIEYLGSKSISEATTLKGGLKGFFNKPIISNIRLPGSQIRFNLTSLGVLLITSLFAFIFIPLSLSLGVYLSYFIAIQGFVAFIIWYLI